MSDSLKKKAIEAIAQKIYDHEFHKKRYGVFPSGLDRAEHILELPAVQEYFKNKHNGITMYSKRTELEKRAHQEIIGARELT
jgi:hypothetical protein